MGPYASKDERAESDQLCIARPWVAPTGPPRAISCVLLDLVSHPGPGCHHLGRRWPGAGAGSLAGGWGRQPGRRLEPPAWPEAGAGQPGRQPGRKPGHGGDTRPSNTQLIALGAPPVFDAFGPMFFSNVLPQGQESHLFGNDFFRCPNDIK